MFVYQTGEVVNVVAGSQQLPKEIPDIQVGFANDEPFVKFGGVKIPVGAAGGTIEMSTTIPFDGADMTVSNPDLTAEIKDGDYYIGGTIIGAITIQTLTTTMYSIGVPSDILPAIKAIVILLIITIQSQTFKDKYRNWRLKRLDAAGAKN